MNKIMKLLEPTKNKVIAGVLVTLVIIASVIGVKSLIEPTTVVYNYSLIDADAKDYFVFEYGESINYDTITSNFILRYGETVRRISYLEENQLERLKDEEDFFFVKLNPIDTMSQPVTTFSDDIYGYLESLDKFVWLRDRENATQPQTLVLDVMMNTGSEPKKVTEYEVKYYLVDSQFPIIDGPDSVEVDHDGFFDVTAYKAYDVVDGELVIRDITTEATDKENTDLQILKVADKNGNITKKEVYVTRKDKPIEIAETQVGQPTNNSNINATKPTTPSKPVE